MHRALILVPLAGAAVVAAVPSDRLRPLVLPITGLTHLGLTLRTVADRRVIPEGDSLGLDAIGSVILLIVSALFSICALYAVSYLRIRAERSNRVVCLCLMVFLAMTSLLVLSQSLGLLWVAVEGTTLATAPLIYFNRNARSIEAAWKYLMVGSVGIALALLGSFFLSYAAHLGGGPSSLHFQSLLANAGGFSTPWLRAAFVLILVGYGTKMGLAPLHTWKPDAYGEAPGMIGALLAGGMTSCAFLALLRVYRIINAAGEGPFARDLLVFMGLLSIGWAAVFMVRQQDLKRLLAYSSIEQMGILVLGLGLGGLGTRGAMLHVVNNALTKGVLFLAVANIHRAYGSKLSPEITGVIRRLPLSGCFLLAGFFAVTGAPPFGPFISEFTILNAALGQGRYLVAALFLALLCVIFLGMGATVLSVALGDPPAEPLAIRHRDSLGRAVPMAISLALVLMLGLFIPGPLGRLLEQATRDLEMAP